MAGTGGGCGGASAGAPSPAAGALSIAAARNAASSRGDGCFQIASSASAIPSESCSVLRRRTACRESRPRSENRAAGSIRRARSRSRRPQLGDDVLLGQRLARHRRGGRAQLGADVAHRGGRAPATGSGATAGGRAARRARPHRRDVEQVALPAPRGRRDVGEPAGRAALAPVDGMARAVQRGDREVERGGTVLAVAQRRSHPRVGDAELLQRDGDGVLGDRVRRDLLKEAVAVLGERLRDVERAHRAAHVGGPVGGVEGRHRARVREHRRVEGQRRPPRRDVVEQALELECERDGQRAVRGEVDGHHPGRDVARVPGLDERADRARRATDDRRPRRSEHRDADVGEAVDLGCGRRPR